MVASKPFDRKKKTEEKILGTKELILMLGIIFQNKEYLCIKTNIV